MLITGHTGFKGAWLAWWLSRDGATVGGYALAPEPGRPNLFEALRLGEIVDSAIADVRDADAVTRAMQRFRPDVVFHLAAQAIVRTSYAQPRATFETNAGGTAAVLDAVRGCDGVRAVVVVTSDKCYAPRSTGPAYREDDPLGGEGSVQREQGGTGAGRGGVPRVVL